MINDSRRLGEQEQLMHMMHAFGGLIPAQALHIRGVLDTALLKRGLAWLQRRHAMLRAHIRYGELVMRRTSPFVFRQPYLDTEGTGPILFEETSGAWSDVFHTEMRRPIPRGRSPRIRFVLVRDPSEAEMSHIIIASDHALFDAQAAFLINRDLLDYIADPAAMEDQPPHSVRLAPPLDVAQPSKSNSGVRGYEPAIRLPRLKVSGRKRRTRVISRGLAEAPTEALRAAIRQNRSTMHGAITAAFLVAIREHYGLEAMSCLSSVDLRRLCSPPLPPDTMGCYIDILRTTHRLDQDFWTLARDVSFKLITTIAKDQHIASFNRVPGWDFYRHDWWPTLTHHRRVDGLGMTTAGDSGLRSVYGNFTLEGVTMATSVDLFGPGLLVLAGERQGALDISICYAEDAVPATDVTVMADRAMACLEAPAAPAQ